MRAGALLPRGLAVMAFGLLTVALTSCSAWPASPASAIRPEAGAPLTGARQARATGEIKEFQLTAGRTHWEVAPGKTMEAYAYNGQVPGPELRVTEGDTVRVTVVNELDEPTTIHWHGVEVPVGMDGVPGLSQEPIPPGGTFTYEFVATPAGTRWYHAHFNEHAQQGGGLVGALIVEPREATSAPPDREYVLVAGQLVLADGAADHSAAAPPISGGSGGMMGPGGMGGMMGRGASGGMMGSGTSRSLAETLLVNGKTYPNTPPLTVREGERVRLRLINAGATETQTFALAGHRLRITHTDGNALARPVESEAVLLGVGERADVEFVADQPGRWQLRGLGPGQAERGLAIDVVYAGHESDPVQVPSSGLRAARYADFAGPQHPTKPDRTYALTVSGGMMGSDVWTINGKSYPNSDPLNVRAGERVRLKLFNMSMEDHPMHLHGHTFQVVSVGGRPVDGPLKDTITVRHMEQYEIEFVADNPGTWLFHCHNLDHMGGGLMTELRYQ